MAYDDLTPSNRFEMALSGDMTAEEASNRLEKILAGADIEPADRLEYFLKLRVSGGGGGGGDDTPVKKVGEITFVEGPPGQVNMGGAATYTAETSVTDISTVKEFWVVPRNLSYQGDTTFRCLPALYASRDYIVSFVANFFAASFMDSEQRIYWDNGSLVFTQPGWNWCFAGPYDIYAVYF